MAHLWIEDESEEWAVLALGVDTLDLRARPPRPAGTTAGDRCDDSAVVLMSRASDEGAGWAVIAAPGTDVRVNGLPLAGGIRLLEDRDEIRVAGASMFFSTETLPRIEAYGGGAEPKFCPRCRQEVAPGAPAVRCPECGVWHHESEELPCWSYAETCALCPQPTDLETAGFRWSPEEP